MIPHEISKEVKFPGQKADGGCWSCCLMGTEFQFGKMENLGDGCWGWLHNNVNALKVTELCT